MEFLLKVFGAALIASVCLPVLKKHAPENALLLLIAASVGIFAAAVKMLSSVWDVWESIADSAALSGAVMEPVAKCVGLGIVTKLCSELCRDSGGASLSSAVELAGTVCALMAVSPLMKLLMEMLGGL